MVAGRNIPRDLPRQSKHRAGRDLVDLWRIHPGGEIVDRVLLGSGRQDESTALDRTPAHDAMTLPTRAFLFMASIVSAIGGPGPVHRPGVARPAHGLGRGMPGQSLR